MQIVAAIMMLLISHLVTNSQVTFLLPYGNVNSLNLFKSQLTGGPPQGPGQPQNLMLVVKQQGYFPPTVNALERVTPTYQVINVFQFYYPFILFFMFTFVKVWAYHAAD
jgi:hypothetical protein